jgi:prepilin-type N-terminal cleavage/methylation domain-containing protein
MSRSRIVRRRAGFTLIELMIVLALLSTFVGSLLAVGSTSTRLCETGVNKSNLEGSARRALDRLARELSGARSDSLGTLPESPLWQEGIDFDRVESIRAGDGRITWSADRAEFRLDGEETDDGLDNDDDGLVDEGALVLVRDSGGAGESAITLAHGVREYLEGELANGVDDNGNGLIDERGVAFERVGRDLRLYLTLEGVGSDGRIVTRTLETTVWSRN